MTDSELEHAGRRSSARPLPLNKMRPSANGLSQLQELEALRKVSLSSASTHRVNIVTLQHGKNEVPSVPTGFWRVFWEEITEPLILVISVRFGSSRGDLIMFVCSCSSWSPCCMVFGEN
jgi:hypothetical protein